MAVFTEVPEDEARKLAQRLGLGELVDLRGIHGGIENTNYFLSTEQDGRRSEWVLTLFERLGFAQLPFYLHLMKHLAHRGIPVPDPQGDSDGDILHTLCGKPAAVVNRLPGHSELAPIAAHCAAVGEMLARLHLAGRDFDRSQPNLRGLDWWNETVPVVLPFLQPARPTCWPQRTGVPEPRGRLVRLGRRCRADPSTPTCSGTTCCSRAARSPASSTSISRCDRWLFDVAVCLNDWCIDLRTGVRTMRLGADAFLQAYQRVRPLAAAATPAAARHAAGRRAALLGVAAVDFHLPREAALLQPHDPAHFERVLRERVARPVQAG